MKNINKSLLAIVMPAALFSASALSHGYITDEMAADAFGSRAKLCNRGNGPNTGCGGIQWEPQSVEGREGFPEAGPEDGKIASGGDPSWADLDAYGYDRWTKQPISAGVNHFTWHKTAPHITRDWKYYITKEGWDSNGPLTREQLDLVPFCQYEGNLQKPDYYVTHECVVPERTGYHIILGVWDVGDTAMSFYNVVDVEFDGESNSHSVAIEGLEKEYVADGKPVMLHMDYIPKGDSTAHTYVTNSKDEIVAINVTDLQDGQPQHVMFNLNKSELGAHTMNVRLISENEAVFSNDYHFNIVEEAAPDYGLEVFGLQDEYIMGSTPIAIDFALVSQANVDVSVTVKNHGGEILGSVEGNLVADQEQAFTIDLSKEEAGHHILSIESEIDGEIVNVIRHDFHLVEGSDDYDFVFPANLTSYDAGVRVLQPKDGNVYECLEFPYSGYCVQWTESANQFEPGVGSHWDQAWKKVN